MIRDASPLRNAADLPAIVGERTGRERVWIDFPFSIGHAIDQDLEAFMLGDRGNRGMTSGAGLNPH
ncbi:hypothetical protein D3C85_977680 [compost metagenome]